MKEYSVKFPVPAFTDYPRTVKDTVDWVSNNVEVERSTSLDFYVRGSSVPTPTQVGRTWVHTPEALQSYTPPPLPTPPPQTSSGTLKLLVTAESGSNSLPGSLRLLDGTTGALEGSFSDQSGFSQTACVIYAGNSKFYVVSAFPLSILKRLNADGSVDNTFATYSSASTQIILQKDLKLLVLTNAGQLVRLNTNGSVDNTFSCTVGSGFGAKIYTFGLTPDQKIIIDGFFTTVNGTTLPPAPTTTSGITGFARLNSNGSLDTSFIPDPSIGANSDGAVDIHRLCIFSDGSILRANAPKIYKYLPNGNLDPNFSWSLSYLDGNFMKDIAGVRDLKLSTDNKFYFSDGRFYRLNFDGSIDTSFAANSEIAPISYPLRYELSPSPDGGVFGATFGVGTGLLSFFRFNSSGQPVNTFVPASEPFNSISAGLITEHIAFTSAPSVLSSNYAFGFVNAAFSYSIIATEAPTSYAASNLPPGLSINTSTGVISGTPTTPGVNTVIVSATNPFGTTTKGMNIQIFSAIPTLDLNTPALRRFDLSGKWSEFSLFERGDIIVVPENETIKFPWGESGKLYDLTPWGEPNFLVPTLPTPPVGFKYKYYIGLKITTSSGGPALLP